MIKQQNELILDITDAINEIVESMTLEEEFYRNLLDRMVVHDKNHVDVYLNLLPYKWSYTVAGAIKANDIDVAVLENDGEGDSEDVRHFDNDIGTEELGHLEMVGSIVSQLIRNVPAKELEKLGLGSYYADHGNGIYTVDASGGVYNAASFASKGDPITDLYEDMAAEQKARTTYENLINLADDYDVINPLKFLREREVVHFQRFGEALRLVEEKLNQKKIYVKRPDAEQK